MSYSLVFTGIHNAGKSTIAKALALQEGAKCFSEIGGVLRSKAACTSWNSCQIFDELVMLREFERDKNIINNDDRPELIILEQWHIGNLAHATIRTPQLVDEYKKRFEEHLLSWSIPLLVFHLSISIPEMLRREITLPGDDEVQRMTQFYGRLNEETLKLFTLWNLEFVMIDGHQPEDKILSEVNSTLRQRHAILR